jgi:hypothetical protein
MTIPARARIEQTSTIAPPSGMRATTNYAEIGHRVDIAPSAISLDTVSDRFDAPNAAPSIRRLR